MNNTPDTFEIQIIRKKLDEIAHKERRNLLISSAIGLAIAWAGFLPDRLNFGGITAQKLSPEGFAMILALIVAYFLFAFLAYAFVNLKDLSWEFKRAKGEALVYDSIKDIKQNNTLENKAKRSLFCFIVFNNKIEILKIIFDLFIPLLAGALALYFLINWTPLAKGESEIFTVLSYPPAQQEKSILFFNNTDTTIIKKGDAESLATFILPFEFETQCQAEQKMEEWEGVKIEPNHEKFLKYLSQQISKCGIKNKPVKIELRGFSSSSLINEEKLKQCKYSATYNANLEIANARSENTRKILEKYKGDFLEIIVENWENQLINMENKRRFNDRLLSNDFDKNRGVLNRRVEIHLMDAGECLISNPETI